LSVELRKTGWKLSANAVRVKLLFESRKPEKPVNWYPSRSDVDNYAKLALDACNGLLWKDDRQIVSLSMTKAYGTKGRVAIQIEEVNPIDLLNEVLPWSLHPQS